MNCLRNHIGGKAVPGGGIECGPQKSSITFKTAPNEAKGKALHTLNWVHLYHLNADPAETWPYHTQTQTCKSRR